MELATTLVLKTALLVQIRLLAQFVQKGSYLQMEHAEDAVFLAPTAALQILPSVLHVLLDFPW